MKDVDVGVGGTAAVAAAILAVFSAGVALAAPPPVVAAVVVVSAEVASKASVAVMTCVGDAAHEGLGSRFTEPNGPLGVLPIVVLSAPAAVLSIPLGTLVSVPVVLSAAVAAAAVHLWSGSRLGGVSGDVFGAANEAARIAALHTGVLLWTLL